MIIKRIDPVSLGKILGFVYALFGLILGVIFAVLLALGLTATEDLEGVPVLVVSVAAVLGMPVVYGVAGFISGLLSGVFYNMAAHLVGGLKIDAE